jgi:hypothetical protein
MQAVRQLPYFQIPSGVNMTVRDEEHWRELCRAAFSARDPNALLQVIQAWKELFQHENEIKRDVRNVHKTGPGEEITCLSRKSKKD